MGWWFGRKSAPADVRPFVPAWVRDNAAEEGFARSFDGITVYVKSTGVWGNFRAGAWEFGVLRGSSVVVGGVQVVGTRAAPIASATGGATIDTEARATIDQMLNVLRHHGLIDN